MHIAFEQSNKMSNLLYHAVSIFLLSVSQKVFHPLSIYLSFHHLAGYVAQKYYSKIPVHRYSEHLLSSRLCIINIHTPLWSNYKEQQPGIKASHFRCMKIIRMIYTFLTKQEKLKSFCNDLLKLSSRLKIH